MEKQAGIRAGFTIVMVLLISGIACLVCLIGLNESIEQPDRQPGQG